MGQSLLEEAFAHHVWATLRVIDACSELTPEQLDTSVPGTYGSILDTIRHLVGADAGYLAVLSGGRVARIDEERMSLAELRAVMAEHGPEWSTFLAGNPDPQRVVVRHRDDGSAFHAPIGIRLAQVVHHGTDHRSQICTALTTLGIEPPLIDLWDYADLAGTAFETPAPG